MGDYGVAGSAALRWHASARLHARTPTAIAQPRPFGDCRSLCIERPFTSATRLSSMTPAECVHAHAIAIRPDPCCFAVSTWPSPHLTAEVFCFRASNINGQVSVSRLRAAGRACALASTWGGVFSSSDLGRYANSDGMRRHSSAIADTADTFLAPILLVEPPAHSDRRATGESRPLSEATQ